MSYGRSNTSGFFFLTIAIAAALTAFLSGAGADEFAEPKSKSELKSAEDVTASAKAERASSNEFKVSFKRDGVARARVFLVPRELATKLDGGISGSLEVKSLVLASNGEPQQLIVQETRGEKRVHEIEFQVGWNKTGSACSLVVQASQEGKWGTANEPRRDIGLPVEDADCRHYIFDPEPTQRVVSKQSSDSRSPASAVSF
jgi:hypothetical protein